jgi:hypothetical protein
MFICLHLRELQV